MEPAELELEADLEVEAFSDEADGSPSVMPWLVPIAVIAGFFAFVVLLVLFIL